MEAPVFFVMIVSMCLSNSLQHQGPNHEQGNIDTTSDTALSPPPPSPTPPILPPLPLLCIQTPPPPSEFLGFGGDLITDPILDPSIYSTEQLGENHKTTNDTVVSVPALQLHNNQTSWYLQGPISTKLIPALYILVLVVGVPANLFTLCSLAFKVRKVSSAIIYCSLALSDLLLLLTLVFKAHYHLHGNHWMFGEVTCRVVTACFYGNLYCSAQTLACISATQYLAVMHPFTYKSLPKRKFTAGVIMFLWLLFGVALVPVLLVRQSFLIRQLNIITCSDILPLYDSHRFMLYYSLVLTVLGLLIPLVGAVVCYVRILNVLNQSHCDWSLYIRISSLVFLIFLVCFTPAGVLHFIHTVLLFVGGTERMYMYFSVAVCLCCLHAAIDPFLFMLMSRSTRCNLNSSGSKGNTLSITASQYL